MFVQTLLQVSSFTWQVKELVGAEEPVMIKFLVDGLAQHRLVFPTRPHLILFVILLSEMRPTLKPS
jgi:hypothetical protein